MASKLFLEILGILVCLASAVFIFSSCRSQLNERDFVLSQHRDKRLIGSWKTPTEDYVSFWEYTPEGEFKRYSDGIWYPLKMYFYTKHNILYVLTLGDGFKRSNSTLEYEYRFSEDGNTLYYRERGDTEESKRQRITDEQKKEYLGLKNFY